MAWWMSQDKETQQSVFYGEEDRISIRSACCEFYRFVLDSCRRTWQEDETPGLSDLHQSVHIWAKPARFDIPQWENAFRHADVQVPWFRRNVNDVQSLLNDAERNGFVASSLKHLSTGVHMPLNDCLWQIRLLKAITEFKSR
ncbi:3'-5' exoribonuclease [uncultured Citrobacter sp.]|uniref:3'-5' exoribonuclease domain-containing protein n=1 Tax=uncultured Citrobacter sp. TaxID=200446 RepID=UPI0025935851|nr:3'-5' exoribonuclease [uncultured Citrobacter sp.]